jgi:3-oxoacyl-[acyl-carrier-protein] synthase II
MEKKKCVITGIGILSCFGSDKEKYYQNLLDGKSGVELLDLEVPGLENLFAAKVKDFCVEDFFDKKNARRVDPAIAYAVAAASLALKDCKVDLKEIDKNRAGVLIGTGVGGMYTIDKNLFVANTKNYSKVSPFFIPHILNNMLGAIVAIEHGFKGLNYAISTACATSNHCLLAAKRHIEYGDCDIMISGGVEASVNAPCFAGFTALHALSKNYKNPKGASKPFDKNRDGFVLGEGAGIFILESEEHALKRGAKIYGEISGGFINSDAYHMTNPLSDGSEVARCMKEAIKSANLSPEDIDYINAHGTSTPIGDLCEIKAIKTVFANNKKLPKINSTKSIIGHTLGASGGLELVAILMAMETCKLHPTINVEEKEEELGDFDILDRGKINYQVNHAISNSFGFGGHNSVLVVSKK